jgi:hypothetical protein
VGFLKFLKRDKSKEPDLGLENADDLDVPPSPPEFGEEDLGGTGKGLPKLPELPELPESDESFSEREEPLPESKLPEKPSQELNIPKANIPKFPEPVEKQGFPKYLEPTVPKLKEGADVPVPPPPMPAFGGEPRPLFGKQKPKVDLPQAQSVAEISKSRPETGSYEKFERDAVREERAVLRHKEAKGPIFIRVERFRDILTGTKTIKNNLKIADQTIVKLNEIDEDRDKVFDKWHNVMTDLQKKLIFIDKTLFNKR